MTAFFQKLIAFFMSVLAFFGIGKTNTADVPKDGYKAEGKTVVICLSSNPSTGYGWQTEVEGGSVVLTASRYEERETPGNVAVAGAGGWEYFTFTAVKAGEATLTFKYLRSWENEPPIKTVTAVVRVDDSLNVTVVSFTGV